PVVRSPLPAVAVVLAGALGVLRPRGRPLAVAVGALALCAGTGGLYLAVGTPAALRAPVAAAGAPQSREDAVAQLAAEPERNPAQPEGWVPLGRSQAALGNARPARDAHARAGGRGGRAAKPGGRGGAAGRRTGTQSGPARGLGAAGPLPGRPGQCRRRARRLCPRPGLRARRTRPAGRRRRGPRPGPSAT